MNPQSRSTPSLHLGVIFITLAITLFTSPRIASANELPLKLREIASLDFGPDVDRPYEILFSQDGTKMAAVAYEYNLDKSFTEKHERELRVWDVKTGKLLLQRDPAPIYPAAVAFSPSGDRLVVTGCTDYLSPISECPLTTLSIDLTQPEKASKPIKINQSLRGQWIRFRDDNTPQLIGYTQKFNNSGNPSIPTFLDFTLSTVALWDLRTGKADPELNIPAFTALDPAAFSADTKTLAVVLNPNLASDTDTRKIEVWDVAAKKRKATFVPSTETKNMAISPDGQTLLSVDKKGSLCVWDVASEKLIKKFQTVAIEHPRITVSSNIPFGDFVATNAEDSVQVWDLKTGKKIASATVKNADYFRTFSPNGNVLAVPIKKSDTNRAKIKLFTLEK